MLQVPAALIQRKELPLPPPTPALNGLVGCFPSKGSMEILDERIKILPCRESEALQLSLPQHSDYAD
jgi:hypothetical protein